MRETVIYCGCSARCLPGGKSDSPEANFLSQKSPKRDETARHTRRWGPAGALQGLLVATELALRAGAGCSAAAADLASTAFWGKMEAS